MLSIIIPVYNQHDMTHECIEAIRLNTSVEYEIVVIDNGSEPAFRAPYSGFVDVRTIRNEENLGFPKAANQGIEAARGDVVCLFNNDVFVTLGWAERLIGWLDQYDIVAPMTNFAAGIQKTVIDTYNDFDELNEAAAAFAEENRGFSQEVNFSIVSMFIKRKVFDDIGYLDFCFRARKAGYTIGIACDVYVHHEGSQTFAEMEKAGLTDYAKVIEQNDKRLAEKWGEGFWSNQLVYDKRQVGAAGGLRLNLGCGVYRLEGFVNIDQFENVEPDLVADATNLSYEPDSVDEIYCGHLLEHLTWEEGQNALRHWLNILKPGGWIRIVVPDFDVLAQNYFDNPTILEMKRLNDYFIYSYVQDSLHRYFYSGALLKAAMAEAGFVELERMPLTHPYYVEPVDWQVGYSGVKP